MNSIKAGTAAAALAGTAKSYAMYAGAISAANANGLFGAAAISSGLATLGGGAVSAGGGGMSAGVMAIASTAATTAAAAGVMVGLLALGGYTAYRLLGS